MQELIGSLSLGQRKLVVFGRALVAVLIVSMAAAAVLGFHAYSAYSVKFAGKVLRPSRDYEARSVQYYLQNDPEWGGDLVGDSNSSIGSVGCLIACVSIAITDLGVPATPGEVNARLSGVGGYQGADLIWYKVNEAFPEIDYKYARAFTNETIENDLKSGLLPIVKVRYKGYGKSHWLLIVGAAEGDFLVYDPLNASRRPIKLATHGRVYSYRVLVPSSE